MTSPQKVRTCLWFAGQGQEAAEFYVSLLPESRIEKIYQPDPHGPALIVEFTLAGAPYMALNGGPQFQFNEAISISVLTKDQAETDRLWAALIANGGSEGHCAWLKDRYGVSWQIVPEVLPTFLDSPDKEAAARAREAMMGMKKIDIAALEAAYRGN